MQGKFLFEYAVIRVMPRVEREEFINVGIILFCAKQKFLKSVFALDEAKVKAFSADVDVEELKENLCAFERISTAAKGSGPIGQYDQASRFRWLTATRSTVVQCSKVHPGFCDDAEETMLRLHQELVL
jgi:phosphopantetheinyl transferase (holo-ACP synthase)